MKQKTIFSLFIIALLFLMSIKSFALIKKTGQAGMTYLSISLGARESALGDASVALVKGVQGLFYNQASLTQVEGFRFVVNQVSWIAKNNLYGVGAAYGFGRFGTVGVDLVYMDYDNMVGTAPVDKAIDPRGFVITGDLNPQDYAIGLSYAYKVNTKFSFGGKVKFVHEDLGSAPIAVSIIDEENGIYEYEDREWSLNHWGFDFGASYDVGYKDLVFAVAFQNFSTEMKYWREEFKMPLILRMGLAMDLAKVFLPNEKKFEINTSIDVLHPNDYTERLHIGTEFVYAKMIAIRAGYKFNYDVENFSFGLGFNFKIQNFGASIDYAYTNTQYFSGINRFSLRIGF